MKEYIALEMELIELPQTDMIVTSSGDTTTPEQPNHYIPEDDPYHDAWF